GVASARCRCLGGHRPELAAAGALAEPAARRGTALGADVLDRGGLRHGRSTVLTAPDATVPPSLRSILGTDAPQAPAAGGGDRALPRTARRASRRARTAPVRRPRGRRRGLARRGARNAALGPPARRAAELRPAVRPGRRRGGRARGRRAARRRGDPPRAGVRAALALARPDDRAAGAERPRAAGALRQRRPARGGDGDARLRAGTSAAAAARRLPGVRQGLPPP